MASSRTLESHSGNDIESPLDRFHKTSLSYQHVDVEFASPNENNICKDGFKSYCCKIKNNFNTTVFEFLAFFKETFCLLQCRHLQYSLI